MLNNVYGPLYDLTRSLLIATYIDVDVVLVGLSIQLVVNRNNLQNIIFHELHEALKIATV